MQQDKISEIIAWRDLADNDYIASRILLKNGFLVQGAILANSAIEKYLKTVCRIENLSFQNQGQDAHRILNLYKNIFTIDPKLDLNQDYLEILTKSYKLRYPDKLEVEYNLALNQIKILVCLDETVYKIRNKIKITGNKRPFKFDIMIKEKYPFLILDNHTFGETRREDLFKKPSQWYEVRVLNNKAWFEADYIATVQDDQKYNLEGLRRGFTDREFNLQSEPIKL